jgi:hypothetical protein
LKLALHAHLAISFFYIQHLRAAQHASPRHTDLMHDYPVCMKPDQSLLFKSAGGFSKALFLPHIEARNCLALGYHDAHVVYLTADKLINDLARSLWGFLAHHFMPR